MRVSVVAALHGDEVFGLKIAGRLQQAGKDGYSVHIGHPEAVAKRRRFLEADLNRSFRVPDDTVEATLAVRLERAIQAEEPDYVIDIHTSRSDVGRVGIVAEDCETTRRLCSGLGMDAMVLMPKSLTERSLIGCFPDRAVSLEFGRRHRSDSLAQRVADAILRLESSTGEGCPPVLRVIGEIAKDYPGLSGIANLVYHEQLKGYPFLAGPNTYENIGGFLAERVN